MPYTAEYTRGDHLRLLNLLKGKKRGIYSWSREYTGYKGGRSKYTGDIWRVVFKMPNGVAKTWLYTDDKDYATMFYMEAFFETFGFYPFTNDQIGVE